MPDPLIQAERLGKKYVIGHQAQRERYTVLRDVVARGAKTFLRKASDLVHGRAVIEGDELEEVWALRDVSFQVERGEVLGIIGRNGAGKSTLLKILSRITEPTIGRVLLRGRVASLLEVGTGFHQELTGRENIFLNGAILGMSRAEIRGRFDEIVAFAEVERFLDTPVKRYSSGMYVRLAFAVAAHLEPEILIVDEVLAVGDAEFQRKCLGKLKDVSAGQGRTVLFVSHNMSAIASLCRSGLVLEQGRIAFRGTAPDAIARYSVSAASTVLRTVSGDCPQVRAVAIDGGALQRGDLKIDVEFGSPRVLKPLSVGVVVYNNHGSPVFGFNTEMDPEFDPSPQEAGVASLLISRPPLHPGVYRVSVWLGEGRENLDHVVDACIFEYTGPSLLPGSISTEFVGSTKVEGRWTVERGLRHTPIPAP